MAKRNPKFIKGVTKCSWPNTRSEHRGRTWDKGYVTLKDGTELEGVLDTTWGEYFYFVMDGQAYKFRMMDDAAMKCDLTESNRFTNIWDFRLEDH